MLRHPSHMSEPSKAVFAPIHEVVVETIWNLHKVGVSGIL